MENALEVYMAPIPVRLPPSAPQPPVRIIPASEPHYFTENGKNYVSVTKKANPHELAIYRLDSVIDWPFFPRLAKYTVDDADPEIATVVLEAYTCTLADFNESVLKQLPVPTEWYVTILVVHIMEALFNLNSNGYLHSSVSPMSICFDVKRGCWKLLNFENAMPIEESLKRIRTIPKFFEFPKRFVILSLYPHLFMILSHWSLLWNMVCPNAWEVQARI